MESYTVENHQTKCRCCIKPLNKRHKHVKINEEIQIKFFSITQINLKNSLNYSDKICSNCARDLVNFHTFKKQLTERQLKLYEFYPDGNEEDPIKLVVKTEEPELSSVVEINIKEEFDEEELVSENIEIEDFKTDKPPNRKRKLTKECTDFEEESKDFKEEKIEDPTNLLKIAETPKRKCGKKKIIYPDGIKPKRALPMPPSLAARQKISFCKDCNRDVRDIRRHWKSTHGNIINFTCDQCGYGCRTRWILEKHFQAKHVPREERKTFKCRYCDFTSVDRCYVQSFHEKTHFGKNFKCNQCDKSYHTKYRLQNHLLQTHEKVKNHQCQFCPKSYYSFEQMKEHEIVNHIKKDIRDVICEICSAAFITPAQLKIHFKNAHIEGPLTCDFEGCPRTFHRVSKKEVHLRVHTKENRYKCEPCNRDFPYTWSLSKHNRVVHGIIKKK